MNWMLKAYACRRAVLVSTCALLLSTAFGPTAKAGPDNDTLIWTGRTEVNAIVPYYTSGIREVVIATENVWDTLVYRDPESDTYVPLLARSFRWLDDRTMEFELREDIKFHDGTTFEADDVVETFNRVTAADSGIVLRSYVDWIQSTEKVAPYRVRIRTKEPYPAALEMLARALPIFPSEVWATARTNAAGKVDYGTIRPVGTGPYKLTEVKPSQSFTMTANPAYFDGPKPRAKIGKVVYRTILDPESAIAELLTGGVDWVSYVPKDKATQMARMPGVRIVHGPTMRMSFLGLDAADRTGNSPFKDIRVRQAVMMAINRQELVDTLVGGGGEVRHSICHPAQVGCTEDVNRYGFDPAAAKRLLAEAGYGKGFSVDLYAFRDKPYAEAVVGYLRAVGIVANLRIMQYPQMLELLQGGKTQMYMHSWGSAGIFDVTAITSVFYKQNQDDYCRDQRITEYMAKGDATLDNVARIAAYGAAFKLMATQLCQIPLFNYGSYYATSDKLAWTPTADEVHAWYRASWTK